jgi:predicted membrane-bound dolichyl-phosphate-mannose-protein mannosyltransferase
MLITRSNNVHGTNLYTFLVALSAILIGLLKTIRAWAQPRMVNVKAEGRYLFPKIRVMISFGKNVVRRINGKIMSKRKVFVVLRIIIFIKSRSFILEEIAGKAACWKLEETIKAAWHTEDAGL